MGIQSLIRSGIVNSAKYRNASAVSVPLTLQYLVIGGGGSGGCIGGSEGGGGGGAGGYRTNVAGQLSGRASAAEPAFIFSVNTSYPVTIGAGGAGGPAEYFAGNPGNRSVFHVITSQGGGGGRTRFRGENSTGGSGGGGNHHHNQLGLGIVAEGFNGGQGPGANNIWAGAGGGGAGALGASTTTNNGGAGGGGLSSNITGTSVTRAGGGGGGGQNSAGAGGAGGGGAGSLPNNNATTGTANTGGGGGGASNATSGSGGSGIVILRYPSSYTITIGAGLTASPVNQAVGTNERFTTITAGTGNVSWAA